MPLVLFQWFYGFGQVAVKLHHTRGEKWIHNRTRKQTSKISLEKAEQLRFAWFPTERGRKETFYAIDEPMHEEKNIWNVMFCHHLLSDVWITSTKDMRNSPRNRNTKTATRMVEASDVARLRRTGWMAYIGSYKSITISITALLR